MNEIMVSDSKKSNANAHIQQNLQLVYNEAFKEKIPSEFIVLIERLRASKQAQSDE